MSYGRKRKKEVTKGISEIGNKVYDDALKTTLKSVGGT